MKKKSIKDSAMQGDLFGNPLKKFEIEDSEIDDSTSKIIPLELETGSTEDTLLEDTKLERPEMPSRWEAAVDVAEHKHVMPVLLQQIRRVEALNYLNHLIALSQDEGYVWVVYGESGSGKSTFFHTLEYQTDKQIKVLIINGGEINLSSQNDFTAFLADKIKEHKEINGENTPLVIVLEERENDMSTEERSAISQTLRNVLRPPGPGKNVIFVLPVTNSNQGTLFIKQTESTGVSIPSGHNALYTFQGPNYSEHVDILIDLFETLNDRDISEYGLQRSDLQAHVSSQQTIGQYIRIIREKLITSNQSAVQIIKSHSYRPFTVIVCFVNPLPGYMTEPTIKGMTINAFGKIRTGEILRVTGSQRAQRWSDKRQALSNIVSALDIRIVEIVPEIVSRLLYVYEWRALKGGSGYEDIRTLVERQLVEENITNYNTAKIVRQNLRTQLKASNLFRIIANEETKSYRTPKYSGNSELSEKQQKQRNTEHAETTITRIVCENSHSRQRELHDIFAQGLEDLLKNSGSISNVANFKSVYSEPSLTLTVKGEKQKVLRPDIVIEMQDKLFLLEFCWRRDDHFTYADIATYVLRKIEESYRNLPLVQTLESGAV